MLTSASSLSDRRRDHANHPPARLHRGRPATLYLAATLTALGFVAFGNWLDIGKNWVRRPALLPFFAMLYAHLTGIPSPTPRRPPPSSSPASCSAIDSAGRPPSSSLFCLGRLFFHDFSELDSLSDILSFIGLGLLLISASWAYSRCKDQIRRYL